MCGLRSMQLALWCLALLSTLFITAEAFSFVPLQHIPSRRGTKVQFHRRGVTFANREGIPEQEAGANYAQKPCTEETLNPELRAVREEIVEEAKERYTLASTSGVFAPERALVASSIGCGVAALFYFLGPNLAGTGSGALERLVLLCKCQIFPSVVLFCFLVAIGGARAGSRAAANDPIATRVLGLQSIPLLAEHAVMSNTLEQYLLLLSTTAALIFRLPPTQLNLIPALYVSWAVCRLLFRAGYTSGDARNRQWFFWGNLMPSLGAALYCIHLIRVNGF